MAEINSKPCEKPRKLDQTLRSGIQIYQNKDAPVIFLYSKRSCKESWKYDVGIWKQTVLKKPKFRLFAPKQRCDKQLFVPKATVPWVELESKHVEENAILQQF